MSDSTKWEAYALEETGRIGQVLSPLGFSLEAEQPHTSGERFLMTREKLVLIGHRLSDGKKVIIKVSNNEPGQREITLERKIRSVLTQVAFANDTVSFPREVFFDTSDNYLFWMTEFIEQNKVFVSYSLEEQFFMALSTFETMEAFHATTFEHMQILQGIFPIFQTENYLTSFHNYSENVGKRLHRPDLDEIFRQAETFLATNQGIIGMYCNHLTHTDFAPSNFRISAEREIYLIDLSSMLFGNKYEEWARFLNYTAIHNPKLEKLLLDYVRKNRGEEEYLCLRLMRVYKIGFLLDYYANALEKTSGNLHALTLERIGLWQTILKSVLDDTPLAPSVIETYIAKRNTLRSEEEKQRQKEFNN